jgi:heme-degrading monooxygenase HmoA
LCLFEVPVGSNPARVGDARFAVNAITTVKRDFAVRRHSRLAREVIMVIIVQHRVRDFDAWKPVFDEHGDVRRRYGATGHEIYRGIEDPNEVTIVNHFASKEQAETFAADPSLKEAMARAGVISEPRMTWAEETETVEY